MPDIPDFWPPRASQQSAAGPSEGADPAEPGLVVPMFPLGDVWLFPGAVLPLNIFEPRYRQMIEDSLDGPGRLVIGTVARGHEQEMPGAPPVYPIAGLGEIGRHERRPDGRFVILLVGLKRVQLEEVESDRLYRKVRATPVVELEPRPERAVELRRDLTAAIGERVVGQKVPDDLPLSNLIDILMLRLPLPHAVQTEMFCELDLERRATLALDEHARRPRQSDD
jgi:uncharacterized protein